MTYGTTVFFRPKNSITDPVSLWKLPSLNSISFPPTLFISNSSKSDFNSSIAEVSYAETVQPRLAAKTA